MVIDLPISYWWDILEIWWWLHSTRGSYGRSVLEVAYERQLFHSTETIWEMLAWEEWLVCRHDASPMVDTPGSTPIWAQYMYFWLFNIKSICIMFWKSICSIKDLGGPWYCLDPTMFRECFWPSMMFSLKKRKSTDLLLLFLIRNWFTYLSYLLHAWFYLITCWTYRSSLW